MAAALSSSLPLSSGELPIIQKKAAATIEIAPTIRRSLPKTDPGKRFLKRFPSINTNRGRLFIEIIYHAFLHSDESHFFLCASPKAPIDCRFCSRLNRSPPSLPDTARSSAPEKDLLKSPGKRSPLRAVFVHGSA